MPTFYRVQPAHRDPAALVGDHHVSRPWFGDDRMVCPGCGGDGCPHCGGCGDVPVSRRGVSCCASLADLAEYFRAHGAVGRA